MQRSIEKRKRKHMRTIHDNNIVARTDRQTTCLSLFSPERRSGRIIFLYWPPIIHARGSWIFKQLSVVSWGGRVQEVNVLFGICNGLWLPPTGCRSTKTHIHIPIHVAHTRRRRHTSPRHVYCCERKGQNYVTLRFWLTRNETKRGCELM